MKILMVQSISSDQGHMARITFKAINALDKITQYSKCFHTTQNSITLPLAVTHLSSLTSKTTAFNSQLWTSCRFNSIDTTQAPNHSHTKSQSLKHLMLLFFHGKTSWPLQITLLINASTSRAVNMTPWYSDKDLTQVWWPHRQSNQLHSSP